MERSKVRRGREHGSRAAGSQVAVVRVDGRHPGQTKGHDQGIGSILRQNMPGPTSENVSAANVQSGSAVESNLGNQSLQGTVPSSSQVQGSVTDSTAQKPWHKSHGLATFDKPG
ncbi:hypothetical protein DdX_14304 [Ditylenchus destructor]|uniref:Uncharacterized protein n=1 Tax=Ditylenchus destructor TaxID=166010 RepID=A0AAD4MX01_9BILA|nr:hypothetical protein DdX_14304 [Ditylenchus destructor]